MMKTLYIYAYANGSSVLELDLPMEGEIVDKITTEMTNAKQQGIADTNFFKYLKTTEPELAQCIEDSFEKWLQDYLNEHLDWSLQGDDDPESFWAKLFVDHPEPPVFAADKVSTMNSFSFYIPYLE